MKKKHLQPLAHEALYARVSSDQQDVDLSVSAQLRALKDYARANGYSVAREYVDEAALGLVADRPQFREMIRTPGGTRPALINQETGTRSGRGTLPLAMLTRTRLKRIPVERGTSTSTEALSGPSTQE